MRLNKRQWEWKPRGWFILLTVGRGSGLGILWCPPMDANGVDIYIGPLALTVQPPMPERYKNLSAKSP